MSERRGERFYYISEILSFSHYQGSTPDDDYPVEESYAIAVNKHCPELLAAFNEVLTEMLQPNADGITEIDQLVLKYLNINGSITNQ